LPMVPSALAMSSAEIKVRMDNVGLVPSEAMRGAKVANDKPARIPRARP